MKTRRRTIPRRKPRARKEEANPKEANPPNPEQRSTVEKFTTPQLEDIHAIVAAAKRAGPEGIRYLVGLATVTTDAIERLFFQNKAGMREALVELAMRRDSFPVLRRAVVYPPESRPPEDVLFEGLRVGESLGIRRGLKNDFLALMLRHLYIPVVEEIRRDGAASPYAQNLNAQHPGLLQAISDEELPSMNRRSASRWARVITELIMRTDPEVIKPGGWAYAAARPQKFTSKRRKRSQKLDDDRLKAYRERFARSDPGTEKQEYHFSDEQVDDRRKERMTWEPTESDVRAGLLENITNRLKSMC